jgi:putative flippase GtrA
MKRFGLFLLVGVLSTLIQFLFLIIFVETELLPEVIASATGYLLSSLFNYWANYRFTFQSNAKHSQAFPKYLVAVAIGLSSNTLLFAGLFFTFNQIFSDGYIIFSWLENYLVAQCFATGITVCLNFAVQQFWIYRHHD